MRRLHPVGFFAGLTLALLSVTGCQPPAAPRPTLAEREARSLEVFRERVVPVLDRHCGSCHAVPPGTREDDTFPPLRWASDPRGKLSSPSLQRDAWISVREPRVRRGKTFRALCRKGVPLESPLLRSPLAPVHAGVAPPYLKHPEVFLDPRDPDFLSLHSWVTLELELDDVAPTTLETPEEKYFAEVLTPFLARKTCFGTNCHGLGSPGSLLFRLDPGIPALEGRYTPTIHKKNRAEMLGHFTRLINPHGDPVASNQMLKILPLDQGGVIHRTGNKFLVRDGKDFQVMKKWIELEQDAYRRLTGAPLGEMRGIVFVRRPRATPERFFEDGAFLPGGDLIWLRDGVETNLTASLHPDGPADVRAPDVRYDGERVVFSMRLAEDAPFDLWEIELTSGRARQLTFSEDPSHHYLDPLYTPYQEDKSGAHLDQVDLVFSSNRGGEVCQSSPSYLLGEVEKGSKERLYDLQRTERNGSLVGRTLEVVRGSGEGYRGTIVKHVGGSLFVDPPMPVKADSTTHYIIEVEPRFAPKYDSYRMRYPRDGHEQASFRDTVKRLTFTPFQVRRPTMRTSGRYVYTALRIGWQKGRPFFNGGLWRSHLDGSDFKQHNGNRSWVPIHADNRELTGGLEVRIGRDADSYWGGMLILSDFRFGPSIETDSPLDALDHPFGDVDHYRYNTVHPFEKVTNESSLIRFVSGWISLDRRSNPRGITRRAYRDPYPLPNGNLLVSRSQARKFDLADPEANPDFDIVEVGPNPSWQAKYGHRLGTTKLGGRANGLRSKFVFPLHDYGFRAGDLKFTKVVGGPMSELWPRPVWVRLKEPVKKILKPAATVFGPPAWDRGFEGYSPDTPGVLVDFDHLMLDRLGETMLPEGVQHMAAEICPACGQEVPEFQQVTWVRVLGADPQRAGEEGPLRRFQIAELPLEPDGSFYLQAPAGMPYTLQALNSQRQAIRTSSRWRYLQPGERHRLSFPRQLFPQSCGSCHGGLTGRPEDARRLVDGTTRASPVLAAWDQEKNRPRLPARPWRPGEWTRSSFARDVAPLVEKRCVSCHAGADAGGGLDLSVDAYPRLRSLVDTREFHSAKSPLVEKLTGQSFGAHRHEIHGPPLPEGWTPTRHPAPGGLRADELLTLTRWIDLGAEP